MNCTCIEDTKKRLADHVKDQAGDNIRVVCNASVIILSGSGSSGVSIPFAVYGDKKPFSKKNGEIINMIASYCPFCGTSAAKAEPVATTATKGEN
jgi:hypothetical protein